MTDEKDRTIYSIAVGVALFLLVMLASGIVVLFNLGPEPAVAHSGLVRAAAPAIECESGLCTVYFRWMSPDCERTLRNAMKYGCVTTGHQIEEDCFAGTE